MVAIYCEVLCSKTTVQKFGVKFFLIFQGCTELIKTDSKYIHVIKDFYFKFIFIKNSYLSMNL